MVSEDLLALTWYRGLLSKWSKIRGHKNRKLNFLKRHRMTLTMPIQVTWCTGTPTREWRWLIYRDNTRDQIISNHDNSSRWREIQTLTRQRGDTLLQVETLGSEKDLISGASCTKMKPTSPKGPVSVQESSVVTLTLPTGGPQGSQSHL